MLRKTIESLSSVDVVKNTGTNSVVVGCGCFVDCAFCVGQSQYLAQTTWTVKLSSNLFGIQLGQLSDIVLRIGKIVYSGKMIGEKTIIGDRTVEAFLDQRESCF